MIFSALYDRVLRWSRHPHAAGYLAALSFAESSFFPIPPDVMLAPMTLANRSRGWYLAGLTTVTSVLGGLAGYLIGFLALEAATPLLEQSGYWDGYQTARAWFEQYGFSGRAGRRILAGALQGLYYRGRCNGDVSARFCPGIPAWQGGALFSRCRSHHLGR